MYISYDPFVLVKRRCASLDCWPLCVLIPDGAQCICPDSSSFIDDTNTQCNTGVYAILLAYGFLYCLPTFYLFLPTGQVGLGVGSRPSNRATEGSNPKGTRLYFVILLKNVEKIL